MLKHHFRPKDLAISYIPTNTSDDVQLLLSGVCWQELQHPWQLLHQFEVQCL
jgi:hypothetical protein